MKPIILVVEDEDDLRGSIKEVLQDRGYKVFQAPEGKTALDLLQKADWRPDLIVSDIMMPVMDGYEFFEAVHAVPELRAVPFIFLTARSAKADIKLGRTMGVDDYLVKPFEPEEFVDAVENKLRRAADIRDQANRELDDARRTMVQLLSHELRTPLTYVSGGTQILVEELTRYDLDPTAELSMNLIQSGTARLSRLTDQMILFSQLVAGHVQIQLQSAGAPVNIHTTIDQILLSLASLISDRRIDMHVNYAEGQYYVFGVADLLTAGISEVVRNAIMYSAEGEEAWVDVYPEGNQVFIIVADHGHGIIPEDLADIWKVLVQSDRQHREQQGAGMGLPIAKRVVEAHGGTIDLQSVINKGTTVTIRLPLY
jgi:signal transduction histidine kinase